MPVISPTVGRVVHYYPSKLEKELGHIPLVKFFVPFEGPLAAIVSAVHSDTMVNLTVFDANGEPHGRTSVTFLADTDATDPDDGGSYAKWMPYQIQQASIANAKLPEIHAHSSGDAPLVGQAPEVATTVAADTSAAVVAADPKPTADPATQAPAESAVQEVDPAADAAAAS